MKAKVVPSDWRRISALLGSSGTTSHYARNKTIFAQGDRSDALFYLEHGKVNVSVVSARGKTAIVAVLEAGQFFGEGCLVGEPRRLATVTATEDCTIKKLTKHTTLRLLQTDPSFATSFINHLLIRNLRVEADLVDQLFNSAEKRLARILLLMAQVGNEGTPHDLILDVNQEALAEMVGTTRSRVSAFMNKFRNLGFIEYNGGLRVHSSLLNVVLRDGNWDHLQVAGAQAPTA